MKNFIIQTEKHTIEIDNNLNGVINILMSEKELITNDIEYDLIIIPRQNLAEFIGALEQCRTEIKSFAYLKGYDAGLNGTNAINTHYSVFKDEQSRNDWEEGNKKGKEAKNANKK